MLLQEHKLRTICRSEYGAIEAAKFQKALNATQTDPVPVTFDINGEEKTFAIPRQECQYYAQIASQEAAPEEELLEYVNPFMHEWARHNRPKMCSKLKDAMLEYKQGPNVVIIWPLCTPDQVPVEIIEKYLKKYER